MEGSSPGNAPLGQDLTGTFTRLRQDLEQKVRIFPAERWFSGSRVSLYVSLPHHRLIPTFFHCHID